MTLLYQNLAGIVDVTLFSAEMENLYAVLINYGIPLFSIKQENELTTRLSIYRKDLPMLWTLAESRGEQVKLCKRRGIYWTVKSVCSRPVVVIGMVLILMLTVILPTRILFVSAEGNGRIPERLLLSAAEKSGIAFLTSRKTVRSERVKNQLLSEIPELKWVGINTKGCTAFICVREREIPIEENNGTINSIVAARDGIIFEMSTENGTPLCRIGQAVVKGETLISPYTDCGDVLLVSSAEGEVYAQTYRTVTAAVPCFADQKGNFDKKQHRISFIIGKKRINLWKDSGIYNSSCDRMYEEYYVTLPGGFRLPFAVAVDTVIAYQRIPWKTEDQNLFLRDFSRLFVLNDMTAGKILEERAEVSFGDGVWEIQGSYFCKEMIGKYRQVQIGE